MRHVEEITSSHEAAIKWKGMAQHEKQKCVENAAREKECQLMANGFV